MTAVVVDASLVTAGLVDDSDVGRWAEQRLVEGGLVAPTLMLFEATNILRRIAARGEVGDDVASLAHAELLDLRVQYVDYEALADRVWELRGAVTVYDAAYVAVAEAVDAPLATLDLRLARSPGPRCSFLTPPGIG